MKRYALESLKKWKNGANRKPLILYGARQVGKTWLMKEFGRTEYRSVIYLDFDENRNLGDFFQQDLDTGRIIRAIESFSNTEITPADTLIIFDELQECQRAKDSLKYFRENAPQYHIVAAGSFLGVATGKFPVGKTDRLTLYPMSFYEFLEAIGREKLAETIKSRDRPLLESLSALLVEMLKTYFYVGGMPEAVGIYAQSKNLPKVREVQKEILQNYKSDFSKHINPHEISKVRMLWDSIPVHLAREKKKFVYRDVKTGGRASEFENALDWLINTGLVYKISRALTPMIPLARGEEREAFKLFMLDTGLLCAKTNVDLTAFYEAGANILHDFHGAMAEQYVCQELKAACENPLFYWGREKGAAEIDFIMQYKNEIIPIEVKSEKNTQSKSLKVYMAAYNPKIAVRTSLKNPGNSGSLYSIPLYMIASLADIIE